MIRPMLLLLAITVGSLLCIPCKANAQSPQEAFPSIDAAIRALGADEFETRQKASEYLWRIGQPAQQALELAAKSNDAEVKLRATVVLRKVMLGITPETPLETQELINRFYDGDRNARQQVINDLRQKGSFKQLFALMQTEKDEAFRKQLFSTMQADVQRLAPQMVASGDWSLLEQWLELGKGNEIIQGQFLAYSLLRGKLPAELQLAEEEFAKKKGDVALVNRIALIHRALGNPQKAIEIIEAGPTDPKFAAVLYREQGNWLKAQESLAKVASKIAREIQAEQAQQAAYLRLQGEGAQSLALLEKLGQQSKTEDVWFGAKAMLLNEQPKQAVELLKDGLQPLAFDLLSQRQQHQAALDLLELKEDTKLDLEWYNQLTGKQQVRTSRSVDRFTYAVSIAAELRLLGKQQQYEQLRALLQSIAQTDDSRGQYWHQLARLERQSGKHREILALYARAVGRNPQSVWSQLFAKKFARAQTWWDALEGSAPCQDPTARLNAIAVAMQPAVYARHVEVDWLALEKYASNKAENEATAAPVRGRLHAALAEAWTARNDKANAEKHWQAAVAAEPSLAAEYGDVLLAEQRWNDAVTQYARVTEFNQGNTIAIFLQGVALVRAGKEAEGKKLQATANLMALDANARYALALALQERNLRVEAFEQFQLLQRTGAPDHPNVLMANQHLGNIVAEKEPLVAADHWEQLRLHLLRPGLNLIDQAGYLDLAVSLHRTRARALLAKQDQAGTLKELAICEAMLPGHIKLVEDFVGPLRKVGLEKEADGLFARTYEVYDQAVKQFPESAAFHNQAAWTAAIAERRLDEALALAERAVKLAPESAAYTDTLAEVHFARGDREQALTWARKAAALAPETKSYEERLQGFSTRELPASRDR